MLSLSSLMMHDLFPGRGPGLGAWVSDLVYDSQQASLLAIIKITCALDGIFFRSDSHIIIYYNWYHQMLVYYLAIVAVLVLRSRCYLIHSDQFVMQSAEGLAETEDAILVEDHVVRSTTSLRIGRWSTPQSNSNWLYDLSSLSSPLSTSSSSSIHTPLGCSL